MSSPKKVVLIVVDGLTPAGFERALAGRRAPALSFLAEHGTYRQATSVFPSLTPVCLSSIATGSGPGGTPSPCTRHSKTRGSSAPP